MKIVGRNNEKDGLMQCLLSKRPEFVVVYHGFATESLDSNCF